MRKLGNEEVPARSAKGINVIIRDVSKENPEKTIGVVQSLEGVLKEEYIREH